MLTTVKPLARSIATVLLLGSAAAQATSSGSHWGYTGHQGPENWGALSEKFHTCSDGRNQSPINIRNSVEAELPAIGFDYHTAPVEILNNGHTVQVNIAQGSSITLDGQRFELKQYHFHTPSENQIEGQSFPLEAHLVHADAEGNLAVVAVMFAADQANPVLSQLWQVLPTHAGEHHPLAGEAKELLQLLPTDKSYYRFSGSLTTPPCSEGVRWLVLQQPVTISQQQVDTIAAVLHQNNRPLQPLNSRLVLK